jgi:hypothetical protein
MKTASIISAVRKHKGPIFVEVSLNNDIQSFQVMRSETLFRLQFVRDDEAEYRIVAGTLIIGRSFGEE